MNEQIQKLKRHPLQGVWENEVGQTVNGFLHYASDRNALYLDVIFDKDVSEFSFTILRRRGEVGLSFIGLLDHQTIQKSQIRESTKIWIDFAVLHTRANNFTDLLSDVSYIFDYVLFGTLPVRHEGGSVTIDRLESEGVQVQTDVFTGALSFDTMSKEGAMPPLYSVEASGISITVNNFLKDRFGMKEIIRWGYRLQNYLRFICGVDLPLSGLCLGYGNNVIVSDMLTRSGASVPQYCMMSIQQLESIFGQTFKMYVDDYPTYADAIEGLGVYGAEKGRATLSVQLARLVSALDFVADRYVQKYIASNNMDDRETEYDQLIENITDELNAARAKLRRFIKKEARDAYTTPKYNFEENMKRLAKYLKENNVLASSIENSKYAKAIRLTRNDIMHGRAITGANEHVRTLLSPSYGLLPDIEMLIRVFVLMELGFKASDVDRFRKVLQGGVIGT